MLNNLIKVKGGGRGVIISGGEVEEMGGVEKLIQLHSGLRTRRRAVRRLHPGGGMQAAGGKPPITAGSRRCRAGFAEG